MADRDTTSGTDAQAGRRELRMLKWLTALVPGTIVLLYESARQEALEHLFPALPSLYANLIIWALVLLLTYAFATFVFRVVERLQVQALARSREIASMKAVVEERARLSRELHDGFAQLVAYLLVRIDTVNDLVVARRIPEAVAELETMRSSTDDLYQDVRESITELRTQVAQRGLPAALREYAEEYEERHGIAVSLAGEDATSGLPPLATYQLLRIVQEALANVRKHARAQQAWIEIQAVGSELRVLIGDDGRGFDTAAQHPNVHRTFGLASMRERTESLGGVFEIESSQGSGTRIKLQVPMGEELNGRTRTTLAPAAG
jgi:signal transduction histidine kinase